MQYLFGVDIGGTTVKIGLVSYEGKLLDSFEIKTNTSENGSNILPEIRDAIYAYLEKHYEIKKYYVPSDRLNQIFKYQGKLNELPQLIKADVIASPYIPMVNELDGQVELCINYPVGQPFIFPQHLTYVQIEEEENLISLIKAETFFKYTEKFMYEVKDSTCDVKLLYVNEKGSLKIKKVLRKLRKFMISSSNFKHIEMIELIEEGGKIDEN